MKFPRPSSQMGRAFSAYPAAAPSHAAIFALRLLMSAAVLKRLDVLGFAKSAEAIVTGIRSELTMMRTGEPRIVMGFA
jgi:hypothetical protein